MLRRPPRRNPSSVPWSKAASPAPRLRRHPGSILYRPRCGLPGPEGRSDPQGPRVRLRKPCRLGQRPVATGSRTVVRRDPHHHDRRAWRLGAGPRGPRVEGDALRGRGVEGTREALHRSLRRAAARVRRRGEGLLAGVAIPFGGHRDGDGRGEGARRRLDVAHGEPRPAGPVQESRCRDPPRRGQQGHVLRDPSRPGAMGLPPRRRRRLDGREHVRGPPADGVLGPRRSRSVSRPFQRGERSGYDRAPRIPDESATMTQRTTGSRTGGAVEGRRAPLGSVPRDSDLSAPSSKRPLTRREWIETGIVVGAAAAATAVEGWAVLRLAQTILPAPKPINGIVEDRLVYTRFPTDQWWNPKAGTAVRVTDFAEWPGASAVWRGLFRADGT